MCCASLYAVSRVEMEIAPSQGVMTNSSVALRTASMLRFQIRTEISKTEVDSPILRQLITGVEVGWFISNAGCGFTCLNGFAQWINMAWLWDCQTFTQCFRQRLCSFCLSLVVCCFLLFLALAVPSSSSCQIYGGVLRRMMQAKLTVTNMLRVEDFSVKTAIFVFYTFLEKSPFTWE